MLRPRLRAKLGAVRCCPCSFGRSRSETHQPHFAAQIDAKFVTHTAAHVRHHRNDIIGASIRVALNEVRVFRRHLGRADAKAPQSETIDDRP